MPLVLKSQKAQSSNKPPSPDEKLFAHAINLQNHLTIWRSYPQPDQITVVGWLRKEHFNGKANSPHEHEELVLKLATGIAGVQAQHASGTGHLPNFGQTGKLIVKSHMELGHRDSTVYIRIDRFKTADAATTGYKLRLEFNPRKLGVPGAKALFKILSSTVDTPFDFGWFLANAWITRLDIAIDFTNFVPSDAIVTAQSQGTTVKYNGADGVLETVQVHSKKNPPTAPKKVLRNPAGPLIVKLYDRNRERLAHGKPPPYAGYQVTRLERTMVKKNPKASLFVNILSQPDPFKTVRLGLVLSAAPIGVDLDLWMTYCAARQSAGHTYAEKLIGGKAVADQLQKAYSKHPSDLLQGSVWSGWWKGVDNTGLMILLEPALVAHGHHNGG